MAAFFDMGVIKRSIASRTALGQTLETNAGGLVFVQANADAKAAVADVVAKGKALAGKEAAVTSLESNLKSARKELRDSRQDYDGSVDFCQAIFVRLGCTDTDVQKAGAPPLVRTTHAVAPPKAMVVTASADRNVVDYTVTMPEGMIAAHVEYAVGPVTADTKFTRVKGIATVGQLKALPPGDYSFRAQCVRGKNESDWFGLVAVKVK